MGGDLPALDPVEHVHWGRIAYREALERQNQRWQAVVDGEAPEAIFTLEHEPVITLGRRGSAEHLRLPEAALRERGVDVVRTDRGGELTYHGPGQLVVYPILAIGQRGIHVGDLVRGLAGAVTDYLAELGIDAEYDKDAPGLWVDGAKIAAVGMRVSRGVSKHGTALNLTTDLDAFSLIVPCGMPDARTTSVSGQAATADRVPDAGARIVAHLARRFGLELDRAT